MNDTRELLEGVPAHILGCKSSFCWFVLQSKWISMLCNMGYRNIYGPMNSEAVCTSFLYAIWALLTSVYDSLEYFLEKII